MSQPLTEPLPPHDNAVEEAVLASILVDEQAIFAVSEALEAGDFYMEAHRWVYEAAYDLCQRNEPINQITAAHELAKRGRLDGVGGVQFLSRIINELPTPLVAGHYAKVVASDARHRQLISVAGQIAKLGFTSEGDISTAVGEAEAALMGVLESARLEEKRTMSSLIDELMQAREENGPRLVSGFPSLDAIVPSLDPGDVMILAALTSVGKSAFAINMMHNMAVKQGVRSVFYSAEMSQAQVTIRLLGLVSGVPISRIRFGSVMEQEEPTLNKAMAELSGAPIDVVNAAGWTVGQLTMDVRRQRALKGLGVVFVDYLQLLSSGRKLDSRAQEVAEVSRGLKALARTTNIPVIALSQLNRQAVEHREPRLSDLKESSGIEQDADIVAFLHRDAEPADRLSQHEIAVLVEKQRNGATGRARLTFAPNYGKFIDHQGG